MASGYHQFCPVAKAMELLHERWTLLVIRETVCGSERFNEIRRGVPRISPSLLSKRLTELTRAGVAERRAEGSDVRYLLTPAGRELRPVVEALGAWGVRWIGELGDKDLDPKLLLWDIHRNIDTSAVPDGRTVVRFHFYDAPQGAREWWIVITVEEVDVCDVDPGFPVAAAVEGILRQMTEVWLGDIPWSDALKSGELRVTGPERHRRALPRWFKLSPFAAVPRPT